MAKSAEKKPSSRTYKSENRERAMRKLAPRVLLKSGYQVVGERTPHGQQFIDAIGPEGPIVVWVKCAWAPGTHGYAAVQIAFPAEYEQTIEWAIAEVEAKVGRTRERGATHMMLLGADNSGKKATSAYLAKLIDIPKIFKETAKIHPTMARNGKSPSMYVEGPTETHRQMVAALASRSRNLVSGEEVYEDQHGVLGQKPPPGAAKPKRSEATSTIYDRDAEVRQFVLQRAGGRCELCGRKGFRTPSGARFLETHHIVPLSENGPDTVDNVIALCPSQHREAHYGVDGENMRSEMLAKLKR